MKIIEPFLWECKCGAIHDERPIRTKMDLTNPIKCVIYNIITGIIVWLIAILLCGGISLVLSLFIHSESVKIILLILIMVEIWNNRYAYGDKYFGEIFK